MLELEVVGNGGDVVASVGLAGDVEVLALELRELLEEFDHELSHVLSDLLLVDVVVDEASVGEASANGLVDVEQVGVAVPGVGVTLESNSVILELVGAVLVEQRDLRGAAWAASQPEYERVVLGAVAGLEPPVEHVVVVGEVNETGGPGLVNEGASVGSRASVSIGSNSAEQESN